MNETERWIRPGQNKVIALVHGIGAKDPQIYWKSFLNVLLNDEQLQSFGVFVWKYPTHLEPGLWRNILDSVKGITLYEATPRIKQIGAAWNSTYQTQFQNYQDVVLICHSMGGLVIKSWIVDMLANGQSASLSKLRHIAFYATPHEGAPVTRSAAWNQQLQEMQVDSAFIDDVGRKWHDHVVDWKRKTPGKLDKRYNSYIPHLVFAGINDNVVPYHFASIKGMDTTLLVGDHSRIICPSDTSDTSYKAWKNDMEQALQGGSVLTSSQLFEPQEQQPFQASLPEKEQRQRELTIFFSYASEDEALVKELEKQLALLKRQKRIVGWLRRSLGAGEEIDKEIAAHLNQARIILLLISPDFLASDQYWDTEVKLAVQKHDKGEACVIPILLRPTDDWKNTSFGKLQGLPKNGLAVTLWQNRDEAFTIVAQGIREVVDRLSPANP
jgi:hypothetical protein